MHCADARDGGAVSTGVGCGRRSHVSESAVYSLERRFRTKPIKAMSRGSGGAEATGRASMRSTLSGRVGPRVAPTAISWKSARPDGSSRTATERPVFCGWMIGQGVAGQGCASNSIASTRWSASSQTRSSANRMSAIRIGCMSALGQTRRNPSAPICDRPLKPVERRSLVRAISTRMSWPEGTTSEAYSGRCSWSEPARYTTDAPTIVAAMAFRRRGVAESARGDC